EYLPSSVLGERTNAGPGEQPNLVSAWVDYHYFFYLDCLRHTADVLLPSFGGAGLRVHEGPAICCGFRGFSAQPAPLVGPRDGVSGVRAHVQSVLSRRIPSAAPVQLGDRRLSAAADSAAQLHRLPAALGPVGVLGRDRGLQ